MYVLKSLALVAATAALLGAGAPITGTPAAPAPPQISIGVNLGAAPVCPYGYFDYAPYDCAPYGYYGPDWFNGGIFVGAGPWFHGRHGFYGHVDNRYDPHNGYHGPMPERGSAPFNHFQGNEARDGQGHIGNAVTKLPASTIPRRTAASTAVAADTRAAADTTKAQHFQETRERPPVTAGVSVRPKLDESAPQTPPSVSRSTILLLWLLSRGPDLNSLA